MLLNDANEIRGREERDIFEKLSTHLIKIFYYKVGRKTLLKGHRQFKLLNDNFKRELIFIEIFYFWYCIIINLRLN